MDRSITVGFDHDSYAVDRNIRASVPGVSFRKVQRLPLDLIPKAPTWLKSTYLPLGFTRVDLLHTWNRINFGPRRWGVSFESLLPRYFLPRHHRLVEAGMRRLGSEDCRFIIAISEWARQLFASDLEENWEPLFKKLHVVYPDQPPVFRSSPYKAPLENETMNVIFVGAEFFRKGGATVVEAVSLVADELNIACTIIGKLDQHEIGARDLDQSEFEQVMRTVTKNERITWHEHLPRHGLDNLISKAHLGLLPTFNDTFGYSVLEFLAAGVPVATSDVSALPEVVTDDVGWLLPVPKASDGYWAGWHVNDVASRRALYLETHERLVLSLVDVFKAARAESQVLEDRSLEATRRVAAMFDRTSRGERLRAIYSEATDSG